MCYLTCKADNQENQTLNHCLAAAAPDFFVIDSYFENPSVLAGTDLFKWLPYPQNDNSLSSDLPHAKKQTCDFLLFSNIIFCRNLHSCNPHDVISEDATPELIIIKTKCQTKAIFYSWKNMLFIF